MPLFFKGAFMDNFLKILEIFSHNWLIILCLVLTIPVLKMVVRAYVEIKLAKLNNHNKLVIHYESNELKKTLEISSSELNLEHLKDQISKIDSKESLLIENKKTA